MADLIFTFDNLLHFAGGALLTSILVIGYWKPWTLLGTVPINHFAWAYIREVAQAENDWLAPLKNAHKLWEVIPWAVGSELVMLAGFLFWFISNRNEEKRTR